MSQSHNSELKRLCEIVARLRAPGGCPWDREQTHATLAPQVLEEAYETVEAIRANDDANLREELGDLLLLVIMHAELAQEEGRFTLEDIARETSDKLVRRHPHVFATSDARDSHAVLKQWDAIKRAEKNASEEPYFTGLTKGLPALMRAQKAQTKAARVGFDWPNVSEVIAKVDEELGETKEAISTADSAAIADEIGDLLFAVVNLARKNQLDAESTLAAATEKFIARFHAMERELEQRGQKLGHAGLEEMDAIWNHQKAASR